MVATGTQVKIISYQLIHDILYTGEFILSPSYGCQLQAVAPQMDRIK